MIDDNIGAVFGMPELRVVTDYDITPELAEQCYNAGIKYYQGIETDLAAYKNKFYALPDFCSVFIHKDTNQVIGYFIILPLTNEAVMKFFRNKLTYENIMPADLQKFNDHGFYNLYLDSKALVKQYQTPKMLELVFSIFVNSVIEKARNYCFCNYVLSDAWKDFSVQLSKGLGLGALQKIKYSNGEMAELYGALFDYKRFAKLPNGDALDVAYDNLYANKLLANRHDLWAEYNSKPAGDLDF